MRRPTAIAMTSVILASLAVFHFRVGLQTVNPKFLDWIKSGDVANHLIGWLFYRNDSWRFPIGLFENLLYPIGTATGSTDSIPLFAMVFKSLSPLYSGDIQYWGIWLALCYAGLGLLGYRLAFRLTQDTLYSTLAAVFVVLSPPLQDRIGHASLCAHWVILAGFLIYLRQKQIGKSLHGSLLALNLFTASVHPYLLLMSLTFTAAAYCQQSVFQKRPRLPLWITVHVLAAVFVLWVFGYFWFESPMTGGFGYYSSDLLSLFNSFNHSRWLPSIRYQNGQYEGFAYLGLGGILLFFLAILGGVYLLSRGKRWSVFPYLPLIVGVALLYVFSLGNVIRFGGRDLLSLQSFYPYLEPIPSTFRASARFVWPFYYAIVFCFLLINWRWMGKRVASTVLALALVIQISDIQSFFGKESLNHAYWPRVSLSSSEWRGLKSKFDTVAIVPPIYFESPANCYPVKAFNYGFYYDVAFMAAREKLGLNSGFTSRPPVAKVTAYCDQLWRDLLAHNLDPRTLYLMSDETIRYLKLKTLPQFVCRPDNEFNVCSLRKEL